LLLLLLLLLLLTWWWILPTVVGDCRSATLGSSEF
jgi:hypothetical protein